MINERNRRRDLEDAEKACVREMAERKKATADPFTRRRCLPTLVTKVSTFTSLLCTFCLVYCDIFTKH